MQGYAFNHCLSEFCTKIQIFATQYKNIKKWCDGKDYTVNGLQIRKIDT